MSGKTKIIEQAERIAGLKIQLAATQARECRMRSALAGARSRFAGLFDAYARKTYSRGSASADDDLRLAMFDVDAALSASGTCPHAGEVERLRKLCEEAVNAMRIGADACRSAADKTCLLEFAARLRAEAAKGGK